IGPALAEMGFERFLQPAVAEQGCLRQRGDQRRRVEREARRIGIVGRAIIERYPPVADAQQGGRVGALVERHAMFIRKVYQRWSPLIDAADAAAVDDVLNVRAGQPTCIQKRYRSPSARSLARRS